MKTSYSVTVRPGLLQQDKWCVYLIPADQPDFELMDSCGIATREEALLVAEHISDKYPTGIVFEQDITVHDSASQPKGEYEQVTGDEPALSGYLADHFKDILKQINKLRPSKVKFEPKKWITSLLTKPLTLAIIGILVYYFKFDINAPDWLVSVLPGEVTSSSQLIMAIPLLMFISAVIAVFRRRSHSYTMNVLRNYLLTLLFKYHWRLEEIIAPMTKELGKIEHAAFSQLMDKWHGRDPDAYKNMMASDVAQSEQIEQAEQDDTMGTGFRKLYNTLLNNDLERRAHALLFLEREGWYRPTRIQFDPYNFLLAYESRSVQCQVIKQVAKTGGTAADVRKLHFQHASFRTVMYFLGATISIVVMYGLISFALYLGVEEAAQQSSTWLVVAVTSAFFALALPFQSLYRVYLKRQGRPRGFYIWEIGMINT